MSRIIIELPDQLHRDFKVCAAGKNLSISSILRAYIQDYLKENRAIKAPSRITQLKKIWVQGHEKRWDTKCSWGAAHNGMIKNLLRSYSFDIVAACIRFYFLWNDPRAVRSSHSLKIFVILIDDINNKCQNNNVIVDQHQSIKKYNKAIRDIDIVTETNQISEVLNEIFKDSNDDGSAIDELPGLSHSRRAGN